MDGDAKRDPEIVSLRKEIKETRNGLERVPIDFTHSPRA